MTVTAERWARAARHGYTHILADGRPAMLVLDELTGATVLTPVTIEAGPST
jgi:hypothetical protein